MGIDLENYASEKHDRHTVARLIFESDPVFNVLVYGKDAVGVIEGMLQLGNNYFESSYTRCVMRDGRVVGVIVGFPVSQKAEIDQKSGKDFARSMGFFRFLSRMPLFIRMDKMMPAVEDGSGYYIHTITVDSEYRGQGLGSEIIRQVAAEHGALYLHVNRAKEASMTHKGHELSQVLMGRR